MGQGSELLIAIHHVRELVEYDYDAPPFDATCEIPEKIHGVAVILLLTGELGHGPGHQSEIGIPRRFGEFDLEVILVLDELVDEGGFAYLPPTDHRTGLLEIVAAEIIQER